LMIMPGRSWVAGIAIADRSPLVAGKSPSGRGQATSSAEQED
jgi:hypothetical protein